MGQEEEVKVSWVPLRASVQSKEAHKGQRLTPEHHLYRES